MTPPPKTSADQFMEMSVTGTTGGKKEKTMEIMRKHMERMLMMRPAGPRVQGPQTMEDGSRERLMARRVMGMK